MTIPRARDAHGASIAFSGLEANVITIAPAGGERGEIDATHLGTEDAKDYVPQALVEAGEVSVTIELDPDDDWTSLIQGDPAQLAITFADGSVWTWATAFVKSFKPAELKMAGQVVESMTDDFNPDRYHDDYQEQLQELIDAKLEGGEAFTTEDQPKELDETEDVSDLLAKLEASVKARSGDGKSAAKKAPAKKAAAKKAAAKKAPAKKAPAKKAAAKASSKS